MRNRLFIGVIVLLATTQAALSQSPSVAGPANCGIADFCCAQPYRPHCWGSAEYLTWWVKSAPVPLVSSGDLATADAAGLTPGALGTPGTTFFNSGRQNFGPMSGGRMTVGRWLDADQFFGVEISGFVTGSRSDGFKVQSDATGNPLITIPAIATPPTAPTFSEAAQPFAVPGTAFGSVSQYSTIRLWGTEANGLVRLWDTGRFRLNGLLGFRYLDLTERLEMVGTTTALPLGGAVFVFQDRFGTRNQVYAGQLGAQTEIDVGRFLFVNLAAKVALGNNHESVDINGNTRILVNGAFPFAPPVGPNNVGGLFAQGTNIGRQTRDRFVVIPDVRLQAGVNLTSNIRAFAGYEFMYLSRAVRPGDQIDRVVNGSQAFGSPLIGVARPTPLFNSSDFWSQGVSVGLQFEF